MILGFGGILPFLGLIPARIAERKGRRGFVWWLYGTTLFVVALPHALIIEDKYDDYDPARAFRTCPHCTRTIPSEAKTCRYCRRDVPPPEFLDEYASTGFLIQSLSAPDDTIRERAIILLGDRGPSEREAVPLLRAMLHDPARRIRVRAEWALERIEGR